jgi:hypothetical protein
MLAVRAACRTVARHRRGGALPARSGCYAVNNDGIASFAELLEACVEQCLGGCEVASEATNELLDCSLNGADGNTSGNDDCLGVCFPPAN